MTDIMVDLETLDTRPTAVILSIGACVVNWRLGEPSHPFYAVVRLDSSREAGLTESQGTIDWWAKQSEEARSVFTDPTAVSLLDALTGFALYVKEFDMKQVKIWGNGSDFDNVILANAYDALDFDAPWRFYNNRCFRTVKNVFESRIVKPDPAGVYHNALDDALYQARVLLQLKDVFHPEHVRSS